MKINVVGKEHTEGTSKKTGKAYSLNIVYYTAAKTGVNGMIAERAALSAQDFAFGGIRSARRTICSMTFADSWLTSVWRNSDAGQAKVALGDGPSL